MPEKKKIVFIVNQKAGITPKSKVIIELLAGNLIPSSKYIPEVLFTEYPGHATLLTETALKNGADIIVAAGGDGTVNEVAAAMINSEIPLGILPAGSGNGLARCLKISMSYMIALHTIMKGNTRLIDTATVNKTFFISIAGVGFDAHVAQDFANSELRGLISYMRIILKEYRKYKSVKYQINIDGKSIEKQALMVSFANSNQFGFRTRIAPQAKIDDGFLDICFVKKMPFSKVPFAIYHLFKGTPGKTGYVEYLRGQKIQIRNEKEILMNIDGEPKKFEDEIEIKINPLSLKVIVP